MSEALGLMLAALLPALTPLACCSVSTPLDLPSFKAFEPHSGLQCEGAQFSLRWF